MIRQECDKLDPRIRRTRHLLHDALYRLLKEKDFDRISVQDITEAATLNRATFYAHYPDKFALLEESIRVSFLRLLDQRHVRFDGSCPSAFRVIILAVCDYLLEAQSSLSSRQHQFEPFLQATVIDQIREVLLEGFRRREGANSQGEPQKIAAGFPTDPRKTDPTETDRTEEDLTEEDLTKEDSRAENASREISPEIIAATASWAIYGAVTQWVHSADRAPQEEFVDQAVALIRPILIRPILMNASAATPQLAHTS